MRYKTDKELIIDKISGKSSWQRNSSQEVKDLLFRAYKYNETIRILDLGCGDGNSYDQLSKFHDRIKWVGVDIESSYEVQGRKRSDINFIVYDGMNIPVLEDSFDIVYCCQVMEHVRSPEELVKDVYRVLKGNGYFIGSTSHLEPFHSHSYWNYTPYGISVLLQSAKFSDIILKPGIDGPTLIVRRMLDFLRMKKLLNPFINHESPLNLLIELGTRILGFDIKRRSYLKLLFSGHFVFIARK